MEKLRFNIDNITAESKDNTAILTVRGWAWSDKSQTISISVDSKAYYRIQSVDRIDVQENFKDKNVPIQCGFQLEIQIIEYMETIDILISDGFSSKIHTINLASYFPLKTLKKLIAKQNEIIQSKFHTPLQSMISNNWKYYIENICLDTINNNLLIIGWGFYKGIVNQIYVDKTPSKNIKVSRHDVKDYYSAELNDAMCGFEISIPVIELSDKLTLIFKSTDSIKLVFDTEHLLTLLKKNENVDAIKPDKSLIEKIKNILDDEKLKKKYGNTGAFFKKDEYKIFLEEQSLNRATYQYNEIEIPNSWISMQKTLPNFTIIIALKALSKTQKYFEFLLNSLQEQTYTHFNLLLSCPEDELNLIPKINFNHQIISYKNTVDKATAISMLFEYINTDYCIIMDQEDFLSKNFFASATEKINLFPDKDVYYTDYDIAYNNQFLMPVKRQSTWKNENNNYILTSVILRSKIMKKRSKIMTLLNFIKELSSDRIYHSPIIQYHFNAVPNCWDVHKSKSIAFYLPQFHENEENNTWWGKGFTEWVNVKRAYPMFKNHDQPRVPGELGYYDLVEDKSIQYKQVALAKEYDITAFCFYYYWFKGYRLLRKPLDQYVENRELDLPYCICWANETWSRRWDGAEKEILMQQVHNEKTDKDFIYDIMPMLRDPRYLKIDGKPLLLIYRIELFPKPAKTLQRWKELCQKEGIGDIHIALVQSFGMVDHRIYGADSSVEFPPHKIVGGTINDITLTEAEKKDYTGNIYDYKEIVDNQMIIQKRNYNLWPGSMLRWDNTARRLKAANVFHNFQPELYKIWLIKNHMYTQIYNSEPLMFINAWNEWAEGTYLEPDRKYGRLLLEITKEVLNYK